MATDPQARYLDDLATGYQKKAVELGFNRTDYPDYESILSRMKSKDASTFIGGLTDYARATWPWRPLSRQSVAAEIAYQYAVNRHITAIGRRHYDNITNEARKIGLQGDFKPLIFSRNVNGKRIPMSNSEAEDAFRKLLSVVKDDVNKRLANREQDQDRIPDEEEIEQEEHDLGGGHEQEQEPEEKRTQLEIDAEELRDWIWSTSEFCDKRNADGHNIDSIGMRPFVDGAKMLSAGIPLHAIKDAMTRHWPEEARRAVGVTNEYDHASFKPENRIPGMHNVAPYVLTLVEQRIPVCLIGKSGTGKTTLAGNIAEHLGLEFGFVSMTRGTSPSAFNGRPRIADDGSLLRLLWAMANEDKETAKEIVRVAEERGDTITSQFVKVYGGGGVYLFDELDAGDENLLLLVNAALANGEFANPTTGEKVEKHPDFIPMAGMNTMGIGATRDHNARNRLDHATLDRWRMGRVIVKLDRELAFNAFNNIIAASQS